jgi:hypothetical protein
VHPVSELYGGGSHDSGGYGNDAGGAYDAWADYDPEAELERLGITRQSEHEHALTWDRQQAGHGDDQADDDTDPDAENYADVYAIIHENDHLPEPRTRQQAARDAARDLSSDDGGTCADDTDPDAANDVVMNEKEVARESAEDLAPGLTGVGGETSEPYRGWENNLPAAEEPRAMTGGPELARQDAGTGTADRSTETADSLRQRVTELETANAELRAENGQLVRGMGELESQNAELGKIVTGLETHNHQVESRLERLEHKVQDAVPSDKINDRMGPAEGSRDKHEHGRTPSSEALLFSAAAVGGILTTAADYLRYLPPSYAGIGASVLAAGAAAVAWARKRREG